MDYLNFTESKKFTSFFFIVVCLMIGLKYLLTYITSLVTPIPASEIHLHPVGIRL